MMRTGNDDFEQDDLDDEVLVDLADEHEDFKSI